MDMTMETIKNDQTQMTSDELYSYVFEKCEEIGKMTISSARLDYIKRSGIRSRLTEIEDAVARYAIKNKGE